jgi:hypothetical protein
MRNLTGTRLYLTGDLPEGLNAIAAKNNDRINLIVHNKSGLDRRVNLTLNGIAADQINGMSCEYLEQDLKGSISNSVGALTHGINTTVAFTYPTVSIPMKPYGIYSLLINLSSNFSPDSTVERTEYFGADTMIDLNTNDYAGVAVTVPAVQNPLRCILRFSIAGVPESRPHDLRKLRIPLLIRINSTMFPYEASYFNEVEIDPSILNSGTNQVSVKLDRERVDGLRQVIPASQVRLISASIVLEHD